MDYEELYHEAMQSDLQTRTIIGITKKAVLVQMEDAETENHVNRATLAANVLSNPVYYARHFSFGIVQHPNYGAEQNNPQNSDTALDSVIAYLWDAFAGTLQNDL